MYGQGKNLADNGTDIFFAYLPGAQFARSWCLTMNKTAQQAEMEYLLAHGLRIGENFHSYTEYPFDANWPRLIFREILGIGA